MLVYFKSSHLYKELPILLILWMPPVLCTTSLLVRPRLSLHITVSDLIPSRPCLSYRCDLVIDRLSNLRPRLFRHLAAISDG